MHQVGLEGTDFQEDKVVVVEAGGSLLVVVDNWNHRLDWDLQKKFVGIPLWTNILL